MLLLLPPPVKRSPAAAAGKKKKKTPAAAAKGKAKGKAKGNAKGTGTAQGKKRVQRGGSDDCGGLPSLALTPRNAFLNGNNLPNYAPMAPLSDMKSSAMFETGSLLPIRSDYQVFPNNSPLQTSVSTQGTFNLPVPAGMDGSNMMSVEPLMGGGGWGRGRVRRSPPAKKKAVAAKKKKK